MFSCPEVGVWIFTSDIFFEETDDQTHITEFIEWSVLLGDDIFDEWLEFQYLFTDCFNIAIGC
jgi:hypothetical protein